MEKLKKGIWDVFWANFLSLLLGLVTGFVLPKILSVDSYASIKTYQLYISYIGLLHLGFLDGIYLKFGGMEYSEVPKSEFRTPYITLAVFQSLITIAVIVLGFIINDDVLLLFAFSIIPLNMLNFYKNIYQATGEFGRYKNILRMNTILTFFMVLIMLIVFRTDDYRFFLWGYSFVNVIVWIVSEYKAKVAICEIKYFSIYELMCHIKSGIFLMLGNFSSILLTSMDRWFIKALMNTLTFAEYSFAVSMENLLTVAITPITTTLYNFFCNNNEKRKIMSIRRYVTIASAIIAAGAFPVIFIIEHFLVKYHGSIAVLLILFSSQVLYVPIKGIYVNLYKVEKKQNKYFMGIVLVVVIGAVLNAALYSLMHIKEAFAIGTLLSALFWYLLCCFDFNGFGFPIREILYSIAEIVLLCLLGYTCPPVIGFIIYSCISLVLSFVIFPNESGGALRKIMKFVKYR